MKRALLFLASFVIAAGIMAQAPQGITHQAVTRNVSNELITNAHVGVKVSIIQGIDWANGPYFIKNEVDPGGGANYTISGTSQVLSIPYALHAKTAESLSVPYAETDPVFTAWDKSSGIAITENQITDLQNYLTNIFGESIGDLSDVDIRWMGRASAASGIWTIRLFESSTRHLNELL